MNVALGTLLWLAAAMQSPAIVEPPRPPDLEVIGQLTNLHYESINDPDDLLGHGWITARLRISRILRGHSASRRIMIRYYAHTYRIGRSPGRLRLRAEPDGTYTVCAEPGGLGLVCG